MQSELLHEKDGKRTFALILETGDEAMVVPAAVRRPRATRCRADYRDRRYEQRHARLLPLGAENVSADPG
jgi:hypothetical protein